MSGLKEITLSVADTEVADAQFDFGFRFLNHIATEKLTSGEKENFAVSPISANLALSMLANSTAGESRDALFELLGFDDLENMNQYNSKLLDYLPVKTNVASLALVNSVWYSDKLTAMNDSYKSLIDNVYKATPNPVDFTNPKTVALINGWSDTHTFGMIPKIVDFLSPRTQVVLANAMYYKGAWYSEFDKSKTVKGDFRTADGVVKADLMNVRDHYCTYRSVDGVQLVGLAFKDAKTTMYFVLPPPKVPTSRLSHRNSPRPISTICLKTEPYRAKNTPLTSPCPASRPPRS